MKRSFMALLIALTMIHFAARAEQLPNVLRIGQITGISNLDPCTVTSTFEFNVLMQLYEGLMVLNPKDLTPQPGLAEKWSLSPDGLTYLFHLRKDARWSDGEPVTAADFLYSWLRVLEKGCDSSYVYLLFYIKNAKAYHEGKKTAQELGICVKDPYTLEIILENPTAYFLGLTALPVFSPLPEHFFKKYGNKWSQLKNIVSNGPFIIKEFNKKLLVLNKNNHYWDKANISLEQVLFFFNINDSERMDWFRQGKLDWVPGVFTGDFQNSPDSGNFYRFPLMATYYYRLNTKRPVLSDKRVREALNLSINRSDICRKIMKEGSLPAYSFVPPRIAGYNNYPGKREDASRARMLLKEAGFLGGKNFPVFSILFNSYTEHQLIAEAVRDMWKKELNITVKLEEVTAPVYWKRLFDMDFDLARSSWVGDYFDPNSFLELYEFETGNNCTGWTDPRFTKLINQGKQEQDPKIRHQFYYQAEKMLMEQVPIIPIYTPISYFGLKPYVKGIYPNMMDIYPLKKVKIE